MRHGDKINNLSRTAAHRKALLSNLATQLFKHKRLFTTVAKAKALRMFVEPLMTRAKKDTMHNRRIVFSYLKNKEGVKALFDEVREKILNRNGGYTRIIKIGHRKGDAAEMAMIELVDFNELYSNNPSTKARKKTKTRRGASKTQTQTKTIKSTANTIADDKPSKLEPYNGPGKKVVVYNTYADNKKLHFDVFIPTDENQVSQVPKDLDSEAVEYAKEFLQLIGKPSDNIAINMCERCHIDNTDLYAGQLWKLPGKEIFIWPMEGCPKPSTTPHTESASENNPTPPSE